MQEYVDHCNSVSPTVSSYIAPKNPAPRSARFTSTFLYYSNRAMRTSPSRDVKAAPEALLLCTGGRMMPPERDLDDYFPP